MVVGTGWEVVRSSSDELMPAAVVGGVEYRDLKLGEKPLPHYFPFESEEAMNEHLEMVRAVRRKVDRAKARETMPFFKRFWSETTNKD